MEYLHFPGCIVPVRAANYEISIRRVARELSIDLIDLDGFSCCGVPMRSVDVETALLMATRNLSLAADRGMDVFTGCTGCAAFLAEAEMELDEDVDLKREVNKKLGQIGREYAGGVKVRHFLRVLLEDVGVERLQEVVKRPLGALKLASHYGCHYLKPHQAHGGFDDVEDPKTLDQFIEITGAETVDYLDKKLCCGNVIIGIDPNDSLAIARQKLDHITAAETDAMVVVCPACGIQYDTNQRKIETDFQVKYGLPVLYYTQLLGLAMGIDPKELALNMNRVKTRGLLEKLGIG